jgi:hypothetical protein
MPSIIRFLQIKIPREQLIEIDGTAPDGKLSATDQATIEDERFLKWQVQNKEGMARLWLTTTNNFKSGGKDVYQLVKEVPVTNGKPVLMCKNTNPDFINWYWKCRIIF